METETHKCNLCNKDKEGCEWQEIGKYWLCLPCKNRVRMRQAEDRAKKYEKAALVIDREELLGLKADGLLPVRTYIYLALRLDYPNGAPRNGIDVYEFCTSWAVNQGDLLAAIGRLSKKGIVVLRGEKLVIETRTRAERIAAMEAALKEE